MEIVRFEKAPLNMWALVYGTGETTRYGVYYGSEGDSKALGSATWMKKEWGEAHGSAPTNLSVRSYFKKMRSMVKPFPPEGVAVGFDTSALPIRL